MQNNLLNLPQINAQIADLPGVIETYVDDDKLYIMIDIHYFYVFDLSEDSHAYERCDSIGRSRITHFTETIATLTHGRVYQSAVGSNLFTVQALEQNTPSPKQIGTQYMLAKLQANH